MQGYARLFNLLCFIFITLLIAPVSVRSATLHVGGTDPSAYSTIQAALDDASPGDTVFVHAGTYSENLVLPGGVILQGEGADVTKIIGIGLAGGMPSRVIRAENVTNVAVKGFTIDMQPAVPRSTGIYAYNASVEISRNIFLGIETGVYASGVNFLIWNNVFYPDNGVCGINIYSSSGEIRNNIIVGYDSGIVVTGRSSVGVSYNDLFQCTQPYQGVGTGPGALNSDPLFVEPVQGNFQLGHSSPCIDAGDPDDVVPPHGGARIDMGAFEYEIQPEIVEGPGVSVGADGVVRIVWQTNTPCTSRVDFGRNAGSFNLNSEDSTLVFTHRLTLSGLLPSATYGFRVSSTDNGGSTVVSGTAYFTTLPAPDSSPPELQVSIPGQIDASTAIHAEAADDTGVESISFYVDDALSFTLFGNTCDWLFDPSAYSSGPHSLKIVTKDKAGKETEQHAQVQVAIPPIDVTLPEGGLISPEGGSTVSGSEVSVEAWARDPESGIASILFYVDDQLLYVPRIQGEPGVEHHASWRWNSFGAENNQDHEIRVEIINNKGMSVSESSVVHVSNTGTVLDEAMDAFFKFKFIKLTRGQVKRDGVYYEAKLYVKNISPVILKDVMVYDTHAGFQAIQSDYGYTPRVRFDPDTFSSTVMYPLGDLHPGEVKELVVNLTSVLVSPDPEHFKYEIGSKTMIDYQWETASGYEARSLMYHLPACKFIEGWYGTLEKPFTTANVLAPVHSRDYLVVTHPRNLYSFPNQILDVDELLSELARFVRHKNAVLAYLDTPAPRSELMNLTGHVNAVPISGAPNRGNWSHLLRAGWADDGYMLLVGETEIIPSFTIILTIPQGIYTIPLCDQPYADLNDDGYPDLVLGRIVGNNANSFLKAVSTSRGVQANLPGFDFDASNALLISGNGNYHQSFINSINTVSDDMDNIYVPPLPNLKYHRTDYSDSQTAWDAFETAFPGHDIVYFDGHGAPSGWGGVVSFGNVYTLDFGGTNPAIISLACSTGEYEEDNDLSIGEAFLYKGAGLFIGATCMTNTGFNSNNGISFFREFWRPGEGVGPKWREFERSLWGMRHQNPYNMRFVLTYNIYGDPKFGYEETKSANAKDASAKGWEPPEGTVVDLPSYTVTTEDDIDTVEIPGGELLVEPGQYQVPFWIERIAIPPGYVVQDVSLIDRSRMVSQRGLRLPVSPDDFLENDAGDPFVPEEYLWYPDMIYQWEVVPGGSVDAGSTLLIMVYPFQYNTETFESRYYTHHEFSFTITESNVEIIEASVEKAVLAQGQPVEVMFGFNNHADIGIAARLKVLVQPYAGELPVGGLPLHTLEIPPGQSALLESWDTAEIPEGHYKLNIILEDHGGNILDTSGAAFAIGLESADVCYGDSEPDGDVDGLDLSGFILNGDLENTHDLATTFGRSCF